MDRGDTLVKFVDKRRLLNLWLRRTSLSCCSCARALHISILCLLSHCACLLVCTVCATVRACASWWRAHCRRRRCYHHRVARQLRGALGGSLYNRHCSFGGRDFCVVHRQALLRALILRAHCSYTFQSVSVCLELDRWIGGFAPPAAKAEGAFCFIFRGARRHTSLLPGQKNQRPLVEGSRKLLCV